MSGLSLIVSSVGGVLGPAVGVLGAACAVDRLEASAARGPSLWLWRGPAALSARVPAVVAVGVFGFLLQPYSMFSGVLAGE